MPRPSPYEITQLLRDWRGGSHQAQEELWPVIYRELKSLAKSVLHRPGPTALGATTLVHEAYLRLIGSESEVDWNDRGHFFAIAARAMRFVLVDEARRRLAKKRDGDARSTEIPENVADPAQTHRPEDVLAVHEALERLAKINPRHEKLVEARYFAGLSIDETAEALDVSRPTVIRDWRAVRTWLYGELQQQLHA
ncbi:MAG: sigma-70 family RNA polymerase sigma factor [bacterium]|nr:sigma-70 family RNA polymerase sigma factor [bacterium]